MIIILILIYLLKIVNLVRDKVNAMSAEDASVYFMKNQKPDFTVDDSTTKTLRSRANFLFKSEFNNGGMIKKHFNS